MEKTTFSPIAAVTFILLTLGAALDMSSHATRVYSELGPRLHDCGCSQ